MAKIVDAVIPDVLKECFMVWEGVHNMRHLKMWETQLGKTINQTSISKTCFARIGECTLVRFFKKSRLGSPRPRPGSAP